MPAQRPGALGANNVITDPALAMERFFADNDLDDNAQRFLMKQTPAIQMIVISEGNITGNHPSKILMGRVKRAQLQQQERDAKLARGEAAQQHNEWNQQWAEWSNAA